MKPLADKAIVKHTLTVYQALLAEANKEGEFVIFRGKITRVFASTGIGNGYYGQIFRQLEGQGCITYIQKGSKSVDSVMLLHEPPTPDGFIPPPKSPLTDPERYANLREDVEALKTLVGGVNIALALQEVERRLEGLETSVTSNDKQQTKER